MAGFDDGMVRKPSAACVLGSHGSASSFLEDQSPNVVGEVGEPDLHLGPHDADGADVEVHRPLLLGEDVLDPGADARTAGVAAADVRRHRSSLRLAVVDLAAKAVAFHEGLV